MKDQHFGTLEKRELHLRWITPLAFERWNGSAFVLCWWYLLDPRRWNRAARSNDAFYFWWKRIPDYQHRCYCPTGWAFDGHIKFFGFGLLWWYSHFTGTAPCPCDEAIDEMFGSDKESEAVA